MSRSSASRRKQKEETLPLGELSKDEVESADKLSKGLLRVLNELGEKYKASLLETSGEEPEKKKEEEKKDDKVKFTTTKAKVLKKKFARASGNLQLAVYAANLALKRRNDWILDALDSRLCLEVSTKVADGVGLAEGLFALQAEVLSTFENVVPEGLQEMHAVDRVRTISKSLFENQDLVQDLAANWADCAANKEDNDKEESENNERKSDEATLKQVKSVASVRALLNAASGGDAHNKAFKELVVQCLNFSAVLVYVKSAQIAYLEQKESVFEWIELALRKVAKKANLEFQKSQTLLLTCCNDLVESTCDRRRELNCLIRRAFPVLAGSEQKLAEQDEAEDENESPDCSVPLRLSIRLSLETRLSTHLIQLFAGRPLPEVVFQKATDSLEQLSEENRRRLRKQIPGQVPPKDVVANVQSQAKRCLEEAAKKDFLVYQEVERRLVPQYTLLDAVRALQDIDQSKSAVHLSSSASLPPCPELSKHAKFVLRTVRCVPPSGRPRSQQLSKDGEFKTLVSQWQEAILEACWTAAPASDLSRQSETAQMLQLAFRAVKLEVAKSLSKGVPVYFVHRANLQYPPSNQTFWAAFVGRLGDTNSRAAHVALKQLLSGSGAVSPSGQLLLRVAFLLLQ